MDRPWLDDTIEGMAGGMSDNRVLAGRTIERPACRALGDVRARVGESPLWSPGEVALWWVDIEGRRLHRHALAGDRTESWPTGERIACIALHGEGGILAAMETGIFHLTPVAGEELGSVRLQTARHAREGMRFNDGRCDRQGRFWVTSMVRDMALADPSGALFRMDADGLSAPQVDGLLVGNGLAFDADGTTLYLSDSHPDVQRIWRFDVAADGALSNRREWVDMNRFPGRPDGAAVDVDGGYWTCANDAGLLLRFDAAGVLDRALRVPVSKPSMCAFGGAGLDRLFVTSIVPARPADGFDAALDGATLVLDPGARGIAERAFGSLAKTIQETP